MAGERVAAMVGLPVYCVRTRVEDRPVVGLDSCIVTVPPEIYASVADGAAVLNVRALGRMLRRVSEDQAATLGEVLHHADWVITADPKVVEGVGMHGQPDCGRCRCGVDQALGYLADQRRDLLVGVLYWAGTPS